MALTAAGVGSGLDIETIVTQLMQVERQPLVAVQRRQSEYRTELSAYGRLKSSISDFQDAMDGLGSLDKFKIFSSTSSDEAVLTATTTAAAAPGGYALQVDRLAQNHKLGSDQFASTQTLGGTDAADALEVSIGATGFFSVDLYNGGAGRTLGQIRDAINDATDNPGVTATILNVGNDQQRLVLTANESGYDQRLQLSYGGSIVDTTLNLQTVNQDSGGGVLADLKDLDASFSVDGFAVTSADNQVSGVMDGIDFELKSIGSANLHVTRDTDAIAASVQSFVDAYNNLQSTVSDLRATSLSGDGTLLSLQGQLRGVMNTAPSGLSTSLSQLSELGIATQKDGTLSLDSGDLQNVLDRDFSGVAELFAHDDQGYAFRFSALAGQLLDTDGLISSREDGINDRIDRLDDKSADWERRLELKEKQLRSQYAALDSLVGQLQSTSQFLFQQLG